MPHGEPGQVSAAAGSALPGGSFLSQPCQSPPCLCWVELLSLPRQAASWEPWWTLLEGPRWEAAAVLAQVCSALLCLAPGTWAHLQTCVRLLSTRTSLLNSSAAFPMSSAGWASWNKWTLTSSAWWPRTFTDTR